LRIAIVTDDGVQISRHFGRAPYYLIVEMGGGRVTDRSLVPKLGHEQFQGMHEAGHQGPHTGSESKHAAMVAPLEGCRALICGGMGMGAYQSLMLKGIKPIVTDMNGIDEAISAYIAGKIDDHLEYLH